MDLPALPFAGLERAAQSQVSDRLKRNPPCPILWPDLWDKGWDYTKSILSPVFWDKGWDSTKSPGGNSRRQRPAGLLKGNIGRTREPAKSQSDANPRKARTACFIHSRPEQGLEIDQVGAGQVSDRMKTPPRAPSFGPFFGTKGGIAQTPQARIHAVRVPAQFPHPPSPALCYPEWFTCRKAGGK